MMSICSLPPEIQLTILNYCDFFSLLQLRQVSKYYKWLAEHNLCHRNHLDVSCDYLAIFRDCKWKDHALLNEENDYEAVFDKIFAFINLYMPSLRELSLRHCPVVLTLAGLIQLSSAAPKLNQLDLSQTCNKPKFGTDAVLALQYFRQLKVLIMDGFVIQKTAGKGCSHRLEVPPLRHMQHLETLVLNCPYDTLARILHSLCESHCKLYRLKHIRLGVRYSTAKYPELLIWFLLTHRSLCFVHIWNALFATNDQLKRFYTALISLPKLTELYLESCELCDRIDSSIEVQFLKSITLRGIHWNGLVRSMRYDPDGSR
uniref:F-box domain-containing protein n=1 Tax=Elaeophora elaphi TaxID=1147741 RepID=A0A0R3RFD4_9BILA